MFQFSKLRSIRPKNDGKVTELFNAMDANAKGKVTKHEFDDFLREHKPKHGPWASLTKIKTSCVYPKEASWDLAAFKQAMAAVKTKGLAPEMFDYRFKEAAAQEKVDGVVPDAIRAIKVGLLGNRITHVGLGNPKIGDDGAVALARMLETNTSVLTVWLQGNCIGDRGAAALGEMMAVNRTITYLDLKYNIIGDLGARALSKGAEANTSIGILNLKGNKISKALRKAVKAAVMSGRTAAVRPARRASYTSQLLILNTKKAGAATPRAAPATESPTITIEEEEPCGFWKKRAAAPLQKVSGHDPDAKWRAEQGEEDIYRQHTSHTRCA